MNVEYATGVLGKATPRAVIDFFAAWGGVARYWELAAGVNGGTRAAVDELVLNPLGPLHREPDRLLLEEIPSALEVRPVLDAIGAGAHRVSEIAGRLGRPATSLSRPLDRLVELGLATRETPFGESPRASRRSLYTIADPFTRLWFRAVAPHRGELISGTRRHRLAIFDRHWPGLVAATWEQLCRMQLPALRHPLLHGEWKPPLRWWAGQAPKWDLVAEDVAGTRLLLGEVKLSTRHVTVEAGRVANRQPPLLPRRFDRHRVVRALFVPDAPRTTRAGDVAVVTWRHLCR